MEQVITLLDKNYIVKFLQTTNRSTRFNYQLPNLILVSLGRSHSPSYILPFIYRDEKRIVKSFAEILTYFEPDNKIYLFGKLYDLQFIKMTEPFLITDQVIYLKETKNKENAIKKFRTQQLSSYINTLNEIYQETLKNYHISIVPFNIKDVKSYFGIFKKNRQIGLTSFKITFSLFLSRINKELIKHVFLHEYAHFIYSNHSKAFYNLLSALDPMCQINKKAIKKVRII